MGKGNGFSGDLRDIYITSQIIQSCRMALKKIGFGLQKV
jgi:hypothetical protein